VRDRRYDNRRAGAGGVAASIGRRLWAKAAHRPVDSLAIFGAAAASLVIVVNAVFLQSGSHTAPFFTNPTQAPPAESRRNVVGTTTSKPLEATAGRAPQTVAARRNDPIAELIGSSSRLMAVQRVLSGFGYGQIRATGILDDATSAAIEKFEREHKLPATGRLSDRLMSELAAMTGQPLE